MAKTAGAIDYKLYPAGMRGNFIRTNNRTEWDNGTRSPTAWDAYNTQWDSGLTAWDNTLTLNPSGPPQTTWDGDYSKWDSQALGAKYTRHKPTRERKYTPTWQSGTTWDDGLTAWNNNRTLWDRQPGVPEPADKYTAAIDGLQRYAQKWATLTPWKQGRWNACARIRHTNGRALYNQCAWEQQTPADKQPISPCARRVTDPTASPFDFTP